MKLTKAQAAALHTVRAGHAPRHRRRQDSTQGDEMKQAERTADAARRWERETVAHLHRALDVRNLSDRALAAAERRAASLTETNCAWQLYQARHAVLEEVHREQRRRAVKKSALKESQSEGGR